MGRHPPLSFLLHGRLSFCTRKPPSSSPCTSMLCARFSTTWTSSSPRRWLTASSKPASRWLSAPPLHLRPPRRLPPPRSQRSRPPRRLPDLTSRLLALSTAATLVCRPCRSPRSGKRLQKPLSAMRPTTRTIRPTRRGRRTTSRTVATATRSRSPNASPPN